MSSNYVTAKNRFDNLMRRLKINPTLFDRYDAVIQNYLEEDIVEMVNDNVTNTPVYYLPHHPVIKSYDKTESCIRCLLS